jgi:hypothetical protein
MKGLRVKGYGLWVMAQAVFLLALAPASFAQGVSSSELISRSREFDGREVAYSGEVIGDVMRRAGGAWVNLNDGDNAMGVWMTAGAAGGITYTGSYKSSGDLLNVVGDFHSSCPEHGGEMDIHARSVSKSASGRKIAEKASRAKLNQVLILTGVLATIWILSLLRRN